MSLFESSALNAVGKTVTPNRCLRYTRQWLGVPAKYATAIEAWEEAEFKHPKQAPPDDAVVPVWFFSDAPARHVALHLSDGSVVTVNGPTVSRFPSIAATTAAGYGSYIGWAEDLNGVRVYTPPSSPQSPTQESEDDMRAIFFIYDHGPNTHASYGSTGVLFPWGFQQTSSGLGPRDMFESAKAMCDASGIAREERHGDQNLLAMHLNHGTV